MSGLVFGNIRGNTMLYAQKAAVFLKLKNTNHLNISNQSLVSEYSGLYAISLTSFKALEYNVRYKRRILLSQKNGNLIYSKDECVMSVKIRKMTNDEFGKFYQWSVMDHVKELMKECHMVQDEAIRKCKEEVAQMLPKGLDTEDNYLASVVEDDSEEVVGFIWTLYEETAGKKQSFVCDFAIWDSKRRKGYGTEAMCLVEKYAREAGCVESVLFVADGNDAARALYQKCGYQILRQADYGKYMTKRL